MSATEYSDQETGMVSTADVEEPDFAVRVERLVAMQKENPETGMRMLAEMYIFVSDFERSARTMALNGGPMAMLKALMGKG